MIGALLITLLPTLLAYILLKKIHFIPKSKLLQLTLSWFTGMYFFTVVTFFVAAFLTLFTDNVLHKATYIILLITQLLLLCYRNDIHSLFSSLKHQKLAKKHIPSVLVIIVCFLFSYLFFSNHLIIQDEKLYTSPIYWDFHWHAALINNFAFGDNFPPQNEAFAGLPHTYHYFWGVFAAIYEVAGLNLAEAINAVSIIAFFFILLGIIGLSEEFFRSKRIGIVAVFLTITSSSLHFTHFFSQFESPRIDHILIKIFTTTESPWFASFLPGNALSYNGTFFNLYYFLEERQILFGVVYMLLCAWVLFKRTHLNNHLLFWIGVCMGGFFLWHLHMTIMVLCALLFLLAFGKDKKKTLFLFAGFWLIFIAHYFYFKSVMQSEWFYKDIGNFPRFNFEFASKDNNEQTSLLQFFIFYGYSYGLKIIFIFFGFWLLFKKHKTIFLLLCAFIVPAFLIINTIQLSPAVITENHKWLRPMNILLDLIVALVLCKYFFDRKQLLIKYFGIVCLFFLTISGIIENVTFFNSRPTQLYSEYPSSIMKEVTEHSAKDDVFIADNIGEVNLAGRKVFLGSNLGGEMRFKKKERNYIIKTIYRTQNLSDFCTLTKNYDIDFVETGSVHRAFNTLVKKLPHFSALDGEGERVFFIDVKKSCR